MTRTPARLSCLCLIALLTFPLSSWAARAVVEWQYDYVNVRATASTSGDLVGQLAAGAEAEILEQREDWTRIRYPGGEGWVVARSLRPLPETPADDASQPAAAGAGGGPPVSAPSLGEGVRAPAAATPPAVTETPARPGGGYLSQYTDAPAPPAFDPGPSVISAISGLLIVLALIAGTVLLVRKLLGSRFPVGRRAGGIRILASRPVAPRQSLLLVEVEGLVWLVGQGPEGLRQIARIDDPRALERLDDRYEFLETPFQSELRRTLDLESERQEAGTTGGAEPADELTREQRLAALRRRGKPTDDA